MNFNIEKIIAKEGLILTGLALLLYFVMIFCKTVPVVLPKYRVQFADGRSCVIVVYPEINYKNALDPGVLLNETHQPSLKLISKRIEEFARQANIDSKPVKAECVNSTQLYLSGIYSYVLAQLFVIKLLFVYIILSFARFVFWAIRTLKSKA